MDISIRFFKKTIVFSLMMVGAFTLTSLNVNFAGINADSLVNNQAAYNIAAKYKSGDVVQINSNAESETNGYSLVNHRNWIGTIVSVSPENQATSSAWEYDIEYPDGEHNEHVAEQDIVTIPAKHKIGDVVQINSNAESETNGYSLVNHRNWIGMIVSVSPKAHASSAWEYDIEYPDGEHNEHVAEQDMSTVPAKYKIGDVVQINNSAESETNGYSLVNHRNWVGIVVSASPKAHASSAWEYDIEYPDGEHNEHVAEQDMSTVPAKYKIGDVVQINNNAESETNGYSLVNHRNWVGTIVSASPKAYASSAWEYDIEYIDGEHNEHVAEQDMSTIPAKYKIGDTIQINSNAESETNGYSLVNHRNWVGTIVSASPKAHANSAWEYDVEYPDGEHNEHVAEQDISYAVKYNHPDATDANTYFYGYCTYYVKQQAPYIGNGWGNANQWADTARRHGYTVNNIPAENIVVVFAGGQAGADPTFGHVAIVRKIEGNRILIQEMNGTAGFGKTDYRWVDNANDYEYIH